MTMRPVIRLQEAVLDNLIKLWWTPLLCVRLPSGVTDSQIRDYMDHKHLQGRDPL